MQVRDKPVAHAHKEIVGKYPMLAFRESIPTFFASWNGPQLTCHKIDFKEPTKKDRRSHEEGTASQHRRGIAEGSPKKQ